MYTSTSLYTNNNTNDMHDIVSNGIKVWKNSFF